MNDAPIAEDIVAIATGLCVEWANSSNGAAHLMAAIAAALMAERERCAKIAERMQSYDDAVNKEALGVTTGQSIAALIRKGSS